MGDKPNGVCHGAPECRCGSRRTVRIGDSALMRLCLDCGDTFSYRLMDGFMVPMSLLCAEAFDEQREKVTA